MCLQEAPSGSTFRKTDFYALEVAKPNKLDLSIGIGSGSFGDCLESCWPWAGRRTNGEGSIVLRFLAGVGAVVWKDSQEENWSLCLQEALSHSEFSSWDRLLSVVKWKRTQLVKLRPGACTAYPKALDSVTNLFPSPTPCKHHFTSSNSITLRSTCMPEILKYFSFCVWLTVLGQCSPDTLVLLQMGRVFCS